LSSVTYFGHQLTQQSIAPDPEKVKAINAIPAPTAKAEFLRFLGMATYLMIFVPNFSAKTQPLREPLKSDVASHWASKMSEAFNEIKHDLTTAPTLHYFDIPKVMYQQMQARMGSAASSFKTEIQWPMHQQRSHWPNSEKELVAVVFACEQFYYYICGRRIVVETDHRPLNGLHCKDFHKTSPRLHRLLLRLQRFTIKFVH
ncbi:polyprotein of retroviral origin, putative, partial [Ixodes scapularis]